MKIIRKFEKEKIHDKYYYKIQMYLDPNRNTLHITETEFSWGHSGWERLDKISTPYDRSGDGGGTPFISSFKTQDKNKVPKDVENLLLQKIYDNLNYDINSREKQIKIKMSTINQYKSIKQKSFDSILRKEKLKHILS